MATKKELLRQRGNIISSLKDKISEDESLLKLFKSLNDVDDKLEKAKDLNDDDEVEENENLEKADEFGKIDSNHDDKISKKEWKEAGKDEEEFDEIDSNGDGVISREEWEEYKSKEHKESEEELKKAAENEESAVKEALKILSEGELSDETLENIAKKYELEVEHLEDVIYELISEDVED